MDDPRIAALHRTVGQPARYVLAALDEVDPLRQPVAEIDRMFTARGDKIERRPISPGPVANHTYSDATISPGHTDLMMSPEAIDEFIAQNPLPDEMGDFLKCLSCMVEMLLNDVDRETLARMRRAAFPEGGE